jgi:hypothetical protein
VATVSVVDSSVGNTGIFYAPFSYCHHERAVAARLQRDYLHEKCRPESHGCGHQRYYYRDRTSTPKQLLQYPIGNGLFDITPDGQHFPFSAVAGAIGQSADPDDSLTVVLKWTSALKK